jgi:hypothetical protein
MLRCALFAVIAAITCLAIAPAAPAQGPRNFPATALRGEVAVLLPPEVLLNGQPARLSPGARIRDEINMLQTTGVLANRRLVVHYTVDTSGLIADVWILTAAERARQPWPTTREQALTWSFDPVGQVWTRP